MACTFLQNRAGRGGDSDVPPCFKPPDAATGGGNGGALYLAGCAGSMVNCLIAGNSAGAGGTGSSCVPPSVGGDGGSGGAMVLANCATSFINCTVADNSAGPAGPGGGTAASGQPGVGGGLFVSGGAPVLVNAILWNNAASGAVGEPAQVFGSPPSVSFTCVQGWTGGLGGVGNTGDDPIFAEPATGNYHLSVGSSCIDSGTNGGPPAGVFTDLEGKARFFDAMGPLGRGFGTQPLVDMGCLEVGAPVFCYANVDASTTVPALNIADFLFYLQLFGANHPLANCDASTVDPVLNINDFICFTSRFAAGCP
jgi:hypothetical protein